MFSQVQVLLSFVYALALTHLLGTLTSLILHRARVRWSGLYLLWVAIAYLALFVSWLGVGTGSGQWPLFRIVLYFAAATAQYFTCSLLAVTIEPQGTIDLPAFFACQRGVMMSALGVALLIFMFGSWYIAKDAAEWIPAEILLGTALLLVIVAARVRPLWMQWAAAIGISAVVLALLFLPSS